MDLVQRLFSYPGGGGHELTCMRRIDEWQGALHRQFRKVHVTGTNGKGSVALKIATALQAAGFRTGLYTSPHICDYRERIQVDSALIEPGFINEYLPKLFAFIDEQKLEPTFFELLTALSFAYFAAKKVDIAVIEVGIGGRLDATNIITPVLSVITSIAADHTAILGLTLDEIAYEKAGIVKEGVPVVVGPNAQRPPIIAAAKKNLILAPLAKGFYDHENNAIARTALYYLEIPESAILAGLSIRPLCRFDVRGCRPVIFDVAHNPDAFTHLSAALAEKFPGRPFHFALAMGKQKDALGSIKQIAGQASRISCLIHSVPRLYPAEELVQLLRKNGIFASASSMEEVYESKGPLVVCGSFYIMDDMLRIHKKVGDKGRLIQR